MQKRQQGNLGRIVLCPSLSARTPEAEKAELTASCRLCRLVLPLCKSHIIPEFIFSKMYDKKHHILEMFDVKEGKFHLIQKGETERLLCRVCESKLNKFERHSRRLFVDALPKPNPPQNRLITIPNLDYRLFKLFLLSILWRASISSRPMYRHVKLGPHEETIRGIIMAEDPGPQDQYPCIAFPFTLNGDHILDIILEPTYTKFDGHRYYRFVFGGFLFMFFVSSHALPGGIKKLIIADKGPLTMIPSELGSFAFLRKVWNLAAEKAGNIESEFGQD